MFYIYAIYNPNSNKIYIGQTADLEERLKMHNNKTFITSYTAKNKGNWILIYNEEFNDRRNALKREKELKSYRGREFIRKHIPE